MNRAFVLLAIAALAGPLALSVAAVKGIDVPPGTPHYNLNLVAKDTTKSVAGGGGNGHRIFVPLEGECRIDLTEEDHFRVTDANCADGTRAGFALPDPDPEDDGIASYRVYIRALGKPGGSAVLSTCRDDSDGSWCSTETVTAVRAGGVSPAMDVSRQTLTVCYDKDGDGVATREQIFDDENADYWWKYSNDGLRLAQLRFYPDVPTDISGPCPPAP